MDAQTATEAGKSRLPAHPVIFEFADQDITASDGHLTPAEPDGVDSLRFRSWLSRSASETGARAG